MARMTDFAMAIERTRAYLVHNGRRVDTGHWQGITTEGKPDLQTMELLGVSFECQIPQYKPEECAMEQPIFMLRDEIRPNLPWADDHFEERVSRIPSNPGEQYKNWPWWSGQTHFTAAANVDPEHLEFSPANFKFDHTYQERYWPKKAGDTNLGRERIPGTSPEHRGIRYTYGDLDDVVALLLRAPYTRQAWLPIFFPEDTGAVHGGRVPCTLGYQFMLRDGRLHMWYVIRSCDYVRHFRDDLYLSARLLLWVLKELQERELRSDTEQVWVDVKPGIFHFHCFSMHYHRGDEHLL